MSGDHEDPADYAIRIIRLIIAELVDDPEGVIIEKEETGAFGTAFDITIHAAPKYYGDLNGKGGVHIRALQALALRIQQRTGKGITLRLVDAPGPAKSPERGHMVPDDNWDRLRLQSVLQDVFDALFEECIVIIKDSARRGGSVVTVIASNRVKDGTVTYIGEKFSKLIMTIGLRNRRHMTLAVTRDQMLFDQATLAAAA